MFWLVLCLPAVCALTAVTGGPGNAVFIGQQQGLYADSFPMPEREVTMELWAKVLTQPGGSSTGSAFWSYAIQVNGTVQHDHFTLAPGRFCQGAGTCALFDFDHLGVQDGHWHHVALTWQFPGAAILYIDGAVARTLRPPAAPRPLTPGGLLLFGQSSSSFQPFGGSGFAVTEPPFGHMDNIRIWSIARNPEDVVALMLTSLSLLEFSGAMSNLTASFTFDGHGSTVNTTTVSRDSATSTVFVSEAGLGGVVLVGGCLNCNNTGGLPILTASECPAFGTGGDVIVRVSEPDEPTLVSLPLRVVFAGNCASAPWLQSSITARLTTLPSHGTLRLLDNSSVVTTSTPLPIFNGTWFANTSTAGLAGCTFASAALVLFVPSAPVSSLGNVSFTYEVAVTNMTSGFTATSTTPTHVRIRQRASAVHDHSIQSPITAVGQLNTFSLGVFDPGEFVSLHSYCLHPVTASDTSQTDGSLPLSVVITKLPIRGRLWQEDGKYIAHENTTVVDTLGRLSYDPSTYFRGANVDSLTFTFTTTTQPTEALSFFKTAANGTRVPSKWDLVHPAWAVFALECGLRHHPTSSNCQRMYPLSEPHDLNISIAPVDLPATTHGYAMVAMDDQEIDLDILSVNSSFANWTHVLHDTARGPDPRRFFFDYWGMQPEIPVNQTSSMLSLYGWCDEGRVELCEKIRWWIWNNETHRRIGLTLHCGYANRSDDTFAGVSDVGENGTPAWVMLGLSWNADMSEVCYHLYGSRLMCLSLPCPVVSDPDNAASQVVGVTRLTVGSALAGTKIRPADGGGNHPGPERKILRSKGMLDDFRLYQYTVQEQEPLIQMSLFAPVSVFLSYMLQAGGVSLLAAVTFDSPIAMWYQPDFITTVFPPFFRFESNLETPRASLESALRSRELSTGLGEFQHGFHYLHAASMVYRPTTLTFAPTVASSDVPTFNTFYSFENGFTYIQPQAYDADNQLVVVRILKFPQYGTLYNVHASNGSLAGPIPVTSGYDSEAVIEQWVQSVVSVSSEWGSATDYLSYHNLTMAAIVNGSVPQSSFAGCYCSLGIIGAADCPKVNAQCATAWRTSAMNQGTQHIDVKFKVAVFVSQVEVYIPYGGQKTVSISAWNAELSLWTPLYAATNCGVSVAVSPSTALGHTVLQANPCRTSFPVDTLRLEFDTDLTMQWLMVDAVRMYGTRGLPTGVVTNPYRFLAYVPNPHVFGTDTFSYAVTDCAFKEERMSEPTVASVVIAGVSDTPFIPSNTTIPVRDDMTTNFSIPVDCIDLHTGINDALWPRDYLIVLLSLPTLGTLKLHDPSTGIVTTLITDDLPYTFPENATLSFVPTTNFSLLPQLCNGRDAFIAKARSMNMDVMIPDSNATTVTLQLSCHSLVCGVGQQVVTDGRGVDVCLSCQQNSYNLAVNGSCKPCPLGGICTGGASFQASTGYWHYKEQFFKCEDGRCCVNGGCTVASNESVCSGGRAGVLCSDCENHDFIPWGNSCVYCTEIGWGPVVLVTLSIGIVVTVMLLNNYANIQSRLKQYVDYCQLFSLVTVSSAARPVYYVQKIGVLGLISINVSSLSKSMTFPCLFPVRGLRKHLVEAYALQFGLVSVLSLWFITTYAVRKLRKQEFDSTQFYHALWQVILLCYSSVVQAGLELLNCKHVGPWKLLVTDDAVECSGPAYVTATLIGVFIAAVIAVFLPLYIFYSHFRLRLTVWHVGKVVPLPLSTQPSVITKSARNSVVSIGSDKVAPVDTTVVHRCSSASLEDEHTLGDKDDTVTSVKPALKPLDLKGLRGLDGQFGGTQKALIRVHSQWKGDIVLPGRRAEPETSAVAVFTPTQSGGALHGVLSEAQKSASASSFQQPLSVEVSYVDGVALVGVVPGAFCEQEDDVQDPKLENALSPCAANGHSNGNHHAMNLMRQEAFSQSQVAIRRSQSSGKTVGELASHRNNAGFSLGEALVQRTRIYRDCVRCWYEAYFLTRRTLFVLMTVAFNGDELRRTQLTFLLTMSVLVFQCWLQPYRVETANLREVALLSCLTLVAGYELLRIAPVNLMVTNTGIPDAVVSLVTAIGFVWIAYHVSSTALAKLSALKPVSRPPSTTAVINSPFLKPKPTKRFEAVVGDLFQPDTPPQQLEGVLTLVRDMDKSENRVKKRGTPSKSGQAGGLPEWLTDQLATPLTSPVLLRIIEYYGKYKGIVGIQALVSMWGRLTTVPSLRSAVDAQVIAAILTAFASADRAPLRHTEAVFNYALAREAHAAIQPQHRLLSPLAIIQLLIVYSKSQPAPADAALALFHKVTSGDFSKITPNHRMVDSVLVTLARADPPRVADAEALFSRLTGPAPSLPIPITVYIVNAMLLAYASALPPPVQAMMSLFERLVSGEFKGVRPNYRSVHHVLRGLSKARLPDPTLSETVYQRVISDGYGPGIILRSEDIAAVMAAYAHANPPAVKQCEELFQQAVTGKLGPDVRVKPSFINTLMAAYTKETPVRLASVQALFEDLSSGAYPGCDVSSAVVTTVLHAYSRSRPLEYDAAMSVFHRVLAGEFRAGVKPTVEMLATALLLHSLASEWDALWDLFHQMDSGVYGPGCKPATYAVNLMVEAASRQPQSSMLIPMLLERFSPPAGFKPDRSTIDSVLEAGALTQSPELVLEWLPKLLPLCSQPLEPKVYPRIRGMFAVRDAERILACVQAALK